MKKLLVVLLLMLVLSLSGFARASKENPRNYVLPGSVMLNQMVQCYPTLTHGVEWYPYCWSRNEIRIGECTDLDVRNTGRYFKHIFVFRPYTPEL